MIDMQRHSLVLSNEEKIFMGEKFIIIIKCALKQTGNQNNAPIKIVKITTKEGEENDGNQYQSWAETNS